MRAVTRTTLTLGDLLEIPIGIAAATGSRDVKFDTAFPDGTPRRQQYVHPDRTQTLLAPPPDGDLTGARVDELERVEVPEVVPQAVKGLRVGERFRVVPQTEIDFAYAASNLESVELLEFVDYRRVPTDRLSGSFYIQADPGFARPLAVLMRAMRQDGKAMLVKWSVKSRQRLGVIRVREVDGTDVLLLNGVVFASEWRRPDEQVLEAANVEDVDPRAVAAARQIIAAHHGTGSALEDAEDALPALLTEVAERALDGLYDEPLRVLELAATYRDEGLIGRANELIKWAEERWTHLVVVHEQVERIVANGGDDVGEQLAAIIG